MKKLSFVALVVLLHTLPLAAQSQEKQAEAYDFKGDRLGMSIEEFTTNHPGQGVWVYCQKCKDEKAWNSTLCGENRKSVTTAFTRCSYTTTVADIPANVDALFVDGKLAAISLGFSAPSIQALALVPQGLIGKFGPPTGQIKAAVRGGGTVLFWENSSSIAEFEERRCGSAFDDWNTEITETLEGKYCGPADVLTSGSRVLYVSKPLGNLEPIRIKEAENEATDKAQSELGQNGPYGFYDLHLGMLIAEFKTKIPLPKLKNMGHPHHHCQEKQNVQFGRSGSRRKAWKCSDGRRQLHVWRNLSKRFAAS